MGRAARTHAFLVIASTAVASCSSSTESTAESSFEVGKTLPELSLVGYIDRNKDGNLAGDEHGALRPSDVAKTYPEAQLLLVHVAFEWCKYCWMETTDQLAWVKHYGSRFMSMQVMVEDRDGRPATRALLDGWIQKHKSSLPTAVEPEATLFARFGKSATYILIDPKDGMKILAVGAGPPQFEIVRQKLRERLGPLPPSTNTE